MMLGLSIEHKSRWYEPEYEVHPIGDYSESKQYLICLRFHVGCIDELKPGMYTEGKELRVEVVEIDD